ncbi:Sec23-binding domain of Sec16-domain-containing protein [Mycena alexandri]|uniref:Protein transport protein sec16 n=1 Tax=Mycena alexandri TaxID=1745969 RepID=A0AAD6TIB7_9AGAR|nr:Sec23-binding domain of Sec16-domain-containing protein [Mycena alexandri]
MSTTEATDAAESAASLFGGDDAASDLFASLGTDSSSQSVFDISPDTLFPGPADADVFPVENGQTADYNSWPEPSQYPSQESSSFQPAVNSSGGGYAPPATSGYAPPAPSTQVYTPSGNSYAPPEKRQHYEPQAYAPPAPATVQNTTLGAPFELKAPANAYASYAPPVPANPPAQPAYNPYAPPPTKQTYAVPPVAPATPSQSAYGPYSPLATTAATYTSPYSNATGNTSYVAQKVAVVPPPPAPAPVLNRPKPNAYDPPFPTARSTRRGVSSSAVRSSVYGAYSQPAPPPPLPAGGQFTSSGYALPPPPPGPASPGGPFPNTAAPNPPYHTPPASGAPIATPPPPRPLSSNYAPNGQAPHLNPRTSYDSVRKVEPANLQSDFDVPPFRSSSPSKSSRPQPSRSDSVSSQASGDASYFPPPPAGGQFGDVHRPSSPGSLSTRSSTISPDPYTNGSTGAPDRTASPASVYSLDSARNPPSLSANPYLPNAGTNRAPSPLRKTTTNSYDLPKPGLTTNGYNVEGAGLSPLTNGLHNSASQYLSGSKPAGVKPPSLARDRSASSGSIYSATASPEQPYPPQHGHGTQQRSETDYGSYTSRYNYNAPGDPSAYDHSASQEIIVKPAQATAYAPSPSLLGANDPLGRTASRAPVFSFGFGGKFLTCFHGASMNTGFDVALSSRNSTGIHIRQLNKIIPQSALEVSSATFPGPLFSDPGTPTTGLVRTTTVSTQTKAKKARLVKYLTDRAEEISQGIGYLHAGSTEGRQAEGKLVLVKLLKILVENDGRLSGTASIDSAVRAALVPKLDATSSESSDLSSTTAGFSSVADFARPMTDQSAIPYPAVPTSESNEAPIATSSLRPSALDKIQDFLLRGERRKAYHFALDEKLWAHAMVIASSIDRDAWKETVNEFLRTELGAKDSRSRGTTTLVPGVDTSQPPAINGREGLRVAYSLYSGQGSASVQELVPQNLLARATGRLQLPTVSHMTPMTPNFAAPALANNIPVESLADWADTAAMMISNPMTADTSAALTALGDQLLSHQWVEAAHACYLLSPQTSPVGGIGNPSARVVLLGSRSPQVWPSFYKDSDPVIFTETLEFALSLAPPIKGQDAFYGLPHLQAYRFIRAMALAELGELQLASRYCEAITASFSRGSPYFTGSLLDQLKALSDRIVGLDHSDKSTFWKSTPSLDTIGRFLEGRFTKLVTGDVDPGTPHEEHAKPVDPNSGPFSQYSTISSATSSTSPSPQPSLYNLNAQNPRSGSAMGQSGLKSQAPIDRASSAMDHVRRRPSPPAPRIASANASTTTFAQAPSFVQAYNNYSTNPYSPSMATPKPHTETPREEDEAGGQEVSWWGSSSYGNDSANQTPVAATFMQVDSGVSASSDGFISLMDDASYSVAPVAQTKRDQQAEDADEDDLGFGNSKPAPKKEGEEAETPTDIQPNAAAASSGSWFGRFWRRSETTPGPVKASLGEETSFYYDKELKRWVNKKAGSDEAKPAAPPPPPPSRPQSASPGMSGPRAGGVATPPPRSASVADMSGPPPGKSAMRVRSTLAAPPETASLPSSPLRQSTMTSPSPPPGRDTPPLGRDTPPPGRPKSQASKRAIRSRYVDVFQQEGAA